MSVAYGGAYGGAGSFVAMPSTMGASYGGYGYSTPAYGGYSYGTPSYGYSTGYPSYGTPSYGTTPTMANPFEHHLPMGMAGYGATEEAPKEKKTRSVTLKKKSGKGCGCC